MSCQQLEKFVLTSPSWGLFFGDVLSTPKILSFWTYFLHGVETVKWVEIKDKYVHSQKDKIDFLSIDGNHPFFAGESSRCWNSWRLHPSMGRSCQQTSEPFCGPLRQSWCLSLEWRHFSVGKSRREDSAMGCEDSWVFFHALFTRSPPRGKSNHSHTSVAPGC